MGFRERVSVACRWGLRTSLSLLVGVVLLVADAAAYEEGPVANGGTLTGKVTLQGKKPVPRGFNLVTFPDPVYCGRISNGNGWRLLREFTVGPDQGLKEVVVMLTGIERGKPFTFQAPRLEAIDCQFKPFVSVVRDQQPLSVVNQDPVMHDIQAYETSQLGPRVLFNVPLPVSSHHPETLSRDAQYQKHIAGQPMIQVIHMTKGRRVFVMQCGFHAYMESWGLAVDNPYYALTDQAGRFEISDIPPGTYRLTVWHPQARKIIELDVTIPSKGMVTANFEIQPREGSRAGMEAVDNPRFGLGILGNREVKPTLELQQP